MQTFLYQFFSHLKLKKKEKRVGFVRKFWMVLLMEISRLIRKKVTKILYSLYTLRDLAILFPLKSKLLPTQSIWCKKNIEFTIYSNTMPPWRHHSRTTFKSNLLGIFLMHNNMWNVRFLTILNYFAQYPHLSGIYSLWDIMCTIILSASLYFFEHCWQMWN